MSVPERPLRLLWITENYYPSRGGMAESCDRIVAGLRTLGVVVDVVHLAHHLPAPRIETKQGGRTITFPLGDDPSHGLNLLWNLLAGDTYRSAWTHVAAFGGTAPLVAGPLYAAWLGLPLVTLIRGNDFDAAIFSPKRSDVLRFALERSAHVCAVSRDKERKIRALYPRTQVTWLPNGIDLASWEALPSDRARAAAWRAGEAAPERRVLGMIGQIKLKKGGVFFLDALLASGDADRFHLLIVGDLDAGASAFLAARAGELHFTLVPFGDRYDLLARYPACDLIVIPSFYDGLPNVLLESAALGVPFIAARAGGMDDLLVDGVHGYLFDPGDTHGCRAAIARAAHAQADELARMGSACRELVASGYDHHTEARAYRDLFARITQPAPPDAAEQPTAPPSSAPPATPLSATASPAGFAAHPSSGDIR